MTKTPRTDKCVKENKHLRFLHEDVWVNDNKITYENPIVFLCQRLERKLTAVTEQRDEARETVESLTTTAFDLLASLEKARDERDKLAEALRECHEDSLELLGERDWLQNETGLDYQKRYQETHNNVTRADEALQSLI